MAIGYAAAIHPYTSVHQGVHSFDVSAYVFQDKFDPFANMEYRYLPLTYK